MKFGIILSALFFSFNAFSAVTILSISGASLNDDNPITTAWGVFVGVSIPGQIEPYDNCGEDLPIDPDNQEQSLFRGCHPRRVNGNTTVNITFRESDEITNLRPIAVIKPVNNNGNNNGNSVEVGDNRTRSPQTGTNQQGSISFTWEDICRLLNNGAGSIVTTGSGAESQTFCTLGETDPDTGQLRAISGSVEITVGFETSTDDTTSNQSIIFNLYSPDPGAGTLTKTTPTTPNCDDARPIDFGFCDISIFPGDSGAFLAERTDTANTNRVTGNRPTVTTFNTFGDGPNLNIEPIGARIFASRIDFTQAQPVNRLFGDALIAEDSGTPITFANNGEVNGLSLSNTLEYIVRAATIDNSGTVSQLMDAITYCPEPGNPTIACSNFENCRTPCSGFFVTPSEVAGIIAENSCFITSITYDSNQAYQVKLFREFRAKFLWTNYLGRKFSDFYNAYGPYGALWIKNNPKSKGLMRAALYPFYGFAYLSVHYGFLFASILYLLGLAFLFFGFKKIKAVIK